MTELKLLQHSKVQTLSHFGLTVEDHEQLKRLVNGEGIDRVVPLGQSLNFSYIWDGYNLLDELSRKVFIQR